MAQSTRSLFIPKLHDLLSSADATADLCWSGDPSDPGSFQISAVEAKALAALAPTWDFHSLSSFVRQLSYYGFKRLSDRRRSSARRTNIPCKHIVFSHPSLYFVEHDSSQLNLIIRKCRARRVEGSEPRRRKSSASSQSSKIGPVTPPLDADYDDVRETDEDAPSDHHFIPLSARQEEFDPHRRPSYMAEMHYHKPMTPEHLYASYNEHDASGLHAIPRCKPTFPPLDSAEHHYSPPIAWHSSFPPPQYAYHPPPSLHFGGVPMGSTIYGNYQHAASYRFEQYSIAAPRLSYPSNAPANDLVSPKEEANEGEFALPQPRRVSDYCVSYDSHPVAPFAEGGEPLYR